jgi:hypothetical protein
MMCNNRNILMLASMLPKPGIYDVKGEQKGDRRM